MVLGVDIEDIVAVRWVDNGPGWVGILLETADAVLGLEPDFSRHPRREQLDIGVVGMHPEGSDALYEVRAFFSDQRGRMAEDPVTGSLNASVAQWLVEEGRAAPPYLASQGSAVGRRGRVHISSDADGSIWVGGLVFDVVSGHLSC
jgi:predicted PhzF superfamily epimerase YddE/YHI9